MQSLLVWLLLVGQQALQREGGDREGFLGEIRLDLDFKREEFGRSHGKRYL